MIYDTNCETPSFCRELLFVIDLQQGFQNKMFAFQFLMGSRLVTHLGKYLKNKYFVLDTLYNSPKSVIAIRCLFEQDCLDKNAQKDDRHFNLFCKSLLNSFNLTDLILIVLVQLLPKSR